MESESQKKVRKNRESNVKNIKKKLQKKLNNIEIYVKYMKPKYYEKFSNGNVHFSTLNTFKDIEENGKNNTIGDKFEGNKVVRFPKNSDSHLYIDLKKDNSNIERQEITDGLVNNKYGYAFEIKYIPDNVKNWGLFCYTILSANDYEIFENKLNFEASPMEEQIELIASKQVKKSFMDNLYREVGGYGKLPVFISNKFFNKLNKYIHDKDQVIRFGGVNYYSKRDLSNVNEKDSENKQFMDAVFTKDEKYRMQKEGRIVLYDDSNILSEIHMGSIKEFLFPVNNKKPILSISYAGKYVSTHAQKYTKPIYLACDYNLYKYILNHHCENEYYINKFFGQ